MCANHNVDFNSCKLGMKDLDKKSDRHPEVPGTISKLERQTLGGPLEAHRLVEKLNRKAPAPRSSPP